MAVHRSIAIAGFLLVASMTVVTAEPHPAQGFVRDLGENAVSILSHPTNSEAEKDKALHGLLAAGFDTKAIGEAIMGSWLTSADPSQRGDFEDVFQNYLLSLSVKILRNQEPDRFVVLGARPLSGQRALVVSQTERDGDALARLDWVVQDSPTGLRVVDVLFSDISLVQTYRSEFRSLAENRGFDALLDALEAKFP